ncbi:MAG: TraM recognition domain-containing protein [Pseudomonadota bacterium]
MEDAAKAPANETTTAFLVVVLVLAYSVSGIILGVLLVLLAALLMWFLPVRWWWVAGVLGLIGVGAFWVWGVAAPSEANLNAVTAVVHWVSRGVAVGYDVVTRAVLTGIGPACLLAAAGVTWLGLSRNTHVRAVSKLGHRSGWRPFKRPGVDAQRLAALADAAAAVGDGTLLGLDENGAEVVVTDHDTRTPSLFVGTTGSGKTTALGNFLESAIVRQLPVYIVDGKGSDGFCDRVRAFCDEYGAPFHLVSMTGDGEAYDPLALGGYTSKKDRLIELRDWSEDHYRILAEGYLQTVFWALERHRIASDLPTVARYLDIGELYALARDQDDQVLVDAIERIKPAADQIASLKGEIQNLVHSEVGHLFDSQGGAALRIDRAFDERAVVYFKLQPLMFPSYARTFGKLITNDIKALTAMRMSRRDVDYYVLWEELGAYAGPQIINVVNQGREAGMHSLLSIQSLSDLTHAVNDAFTGLVVENCNNYSIMRANAPDNAEALAGIVGTHITPQYTLQLDKQGATGAASLKHEREYRVHPDDIKWLEQGRAILVRKGRGLVERIHVRHSRIG